MFDLRTVYCSDGQQRVTAAGKIDYRGADDLDLLQTIVVETESFKRRQGSVEGSIEIRKIIGLEVQILQFG